VLVHYRGADGEGFKTSRMYQTAAKDGVFQGTVPGNMIGELGFQYYITAGGGGETANYPAGDPDDPAYLPAYIGVTLTEEPLPAPPANQYIMMGLPFNPVQTTGAILTGAFGPYDKSKYRFGRWNPGTSKYDEYPNTEPFAPGRGYWLIQKNPREMPALGVSTSTVGGVTIDLLSGWNMISNPYNFPIAWSSVGKGANVEDRLVARAGGIYTDVDVMNPWQGYWVLNTSGPLTTISIPPTQAMVKAAEPKAQPASDKIWEIVIDAEMGEGDTYRADQRNVAGVWTQATAGVDKMDFHEVPAMPGDVRVFFEREQDGKIHDLSTDRRAPFIDGASWDVIVRTENKARVELSLSGVADVPSEFAVILITETGQIDLRETDTATITVGDGGEARLRLAVGDPQFVAEQEQNLPRPFALRPNYPNPFNPMTKVVFTLPRDSRVVVDIYDMRGRRVHRLVDDSFGPGLHEVDWTGRDDNGREVSAGVYFSRMRTEDFEQTRKMTLVR
jgi:flagellar hook capping protein FlgD